MLREPRPDGSRPAGDRTGPGLGEPAARHFPHDAHDQGGAGFLGLVVLEKLAHAAESLLGKLRDGACLPMARGSCVLLATVDKCREGLLLLETRGSDAGFEFEATVVQLLTAERASLAGPSTACQVSPPTVKPTAPRELDVKLTMPAGDAARPAQSPAGAASPATAAPKAGSAGGEGSTPDKNPLSAGESTIRVDVGLLDKLMTRVGELVLARNQIVQYTSRLEDASFISTAQRLNLITTELQESVMKTRMQPIGNVWAKFPRVVRDLASQLGKQVRIDMEGKETELDKTIVEAIKDPLTHLVRNSVDHGIETARGSRRRRQAGRGPPAVARLSRRRPGQHRDHGRRRRVEPRSHSQQRPSNADCCPPTRRRGCRTATPAN